MDSADTISRATTDLLWSLWTELGVNGVVRKHAQVIIDPEALLLFSPLLVASDPRLLELIYSWCVKHHGLIAPSRLSGLRKTLPPEVTGPFDCFAATVRANTPARWTIPKGASPWSTVPALRRVSMDLTRPALRTLRLRAILGVSARADVLGALLSEPGEWVTASQLTPLGYSKRAIALILHDLHEARLIDAQPEKNRITYRLAVGAELGALAGPPGLTNPRWLDVFSLVTLAHTLITHQARLPTLRRVAAHKLVEQARPFAARLNLAPPPKTAGDPEAFEEALRWFSQHLEGLASSSSPAFAGPTVR